MVNALVHPPPPPTPHTPHPSLVPPVLCGNCLDRCCCCKSAPEDWDVAKPVAGCLSASKQQKQTALLEFSRRQNLLCDGLDLLYKALAESCSRFLMLMFYVTGLSFRYKCGGLGVVSAAIAHLGWKWITQSPFELSCQWPVKDGRHIVLSCLCRSIGIGENN